MIQVVLHYAHTFEICTFHFHSYHSVKANPLIYKRVKCSLAVAFVALHLWLSCNCLERISILTLQNKRLTLALVSGYILTWKWKRRWWCGRRDASDGPQEEEDRWVLWPGRCDWSWGRRLCLVSSGPGSSFWTPGTQEWDLTYVIHTTYIIDYLSRLYI